MNLCNSGVVGLEELVEGNVPGCSRSQRAFSLSGLPGWRRATSIGMPLCGEMTSL